MCAPTSCRSRKIRLVRVPGVHGLAAIDEILLNVCAKRGQHPAVTEKGLMSPTTLLAYVRIISFRAACSCRRCAKNVGGLEVPPERRFLKRLAASGIWRERGIETRL